MDPMDIDIIICATVTPDMLFPSTANLIGHKAGAHKAWGFDLSAACSGFLFALTTGAQFVENGSAKNVVVVGADKMSSIIDYTDRTTCVPWGRRSGRVAPTRRRRLWRVGQPIALRRRRWKLPVHARWGVRPPCKPRHCRCEAATSFTKTDNPSSKPQ